MRPVPAPTQSATLSPSSSDYIPGSLTWPRLLAELTASARRERSGLIGRLSSVNRYPVSSVDNCTPPPPQLQTLLLQAAQQSLPGRPCLGALKNFDFEHWGSRCQEQQMLSLGSRGEGGRRGSAEGAPRAGWPDGKSKQTFRGIASE